MTSVILLSVALSSLNDRITPSYLAGCFRATAGYKRYHQPAAAACKDKSGGHLANHIRDEGLVAPQQHERWCSRITSLSVDAHNTNEMSRFIPSNLLMTSSPAKASPHCHVVYCLRHRPATRVNTLAPPAWYCWGWRCLTIEAFIMAFLKLPIDKI